MAIRLNKTGDHIQQGTVEYTADAASDIAALPTGVTPGSECFCIEESKTYILNNSKEWKEKKQGSGGGSGGGGGSSYPSADGRSFPLYNDDVTLLTQSQYYNDIAKAINEKYGEDNSYLPSQMATAIENIPSGGGELFVPEISETLICDNEGAEYNDPIILTEDYHNYDFIKFVMYDSQDDIDIIILTSPEAMDNIFLYSSNRMCLDKFDSNYYYCFTKTSNTQFEYYARRNCTIKSIYGITGINCEFNKTVIQNREGIGSSQVSITSATSLFDYDFLMFTTCTNDSTETLPAANNPFYINKNLFNTNTYDLMIHKYNSYSSLNMTEYSLQSWYYYFYVEGVTITPKEES